MKRYLAIVGLATLLAACGPSQQPQTNVNDAAAEPSPEATGDLTPAPVVRKKGVDLLTSDFGVMPDFRYAVVYDIVDKNTVGVRRHRVLLEVLGEQDIETALGKMDATLVALGYEKSKDTVTDRGHEEVFRKKGTPTLVLLAQSAASGPQLKNADAVGTIHVMWNIR